MRSSQHAQRLFNRSRRFFQQPISVRKIPGPKEFSLSDGRTKGDFQAPATLDQPWHGSGAEVRVLIISMPRRSTYGLGIIYNIYIYIYQRPPTGLLRTLLLTKVVGGDLLEGAGI